MSRIIRFNRFFLLCICIVSAITLKGQNAWLNKKVNLSCGQVMLKTVLKSISTQTGCVFSYDPTKIEDKQVVNISIKGSLSLRAALSKALPKNIVYKMNGKYIVLQGLEGKAVIDKKVPVIKPQKQNKPLNQNAKGRGTIDKDLALERLVLPPIQSNTNSGFVVLTDDSLMKPLTDSVGLTQNIIPVQKADSNLLVPVIADTVLKEPVLVNDIPKTDTVKIVPSGFSNFVVKNGYLEMAVSLSKQLGAVSIRPGLYNVYAILSIGSDYNKSYLFGIGAGIHIKIDTHFSLNFDLLRNAIIAGKTYVLAVRASNTQILPMLNYSIGTSYKIFAGPTVNLINSSYINSISTTNLGAIVGIGFSLGIKVNLKSILSKRI
jgi:hypothetical protein